nr:NAD-dependent epimerase/dehydratase family protein [Nocardioides marinus]
MVTGASGFIGTNLLRSLRQGSDVMGYDVKPPMDPQQWDLYRYGDIRDLKSLTRAYAEFDPDFVINLAARTDLGGRSLADYSANTVGVENVCEVSNERDVPTIYASSRLVFAIDHRPAGVFDYAPSTVYGESKIVGELVVRQRASHKWCIVRPTSIWGPWFGTPYGDFFKVVARGRFLKAAGLHPVKSFGYVGNIVAQISGMLGLEPSKWDRGVYWLKDREPLDMYGWSDEVARQLGRRPAPDVPRSVLQGLATLGDLLKATQFLEPPLTTFRLNNMLTDMVYEEKELYQLLPGPDPISVADGVAETVAWLRTR